MWEDFIPYILAFIPTYAFDVLVSVLGSNDSVRVLLSSVSVEMGVASRPLFGC